MARPCRKSNSDSDHQPSIFGMDKSDSEHVSVRRSSTASPTKLTSSKPAATVIASAAPHKNENQCRMHAGLRHGEWLHGAMLHDLYLGGTGGGNSAIHHARRH